MRDVKSRVGRREFVNAVTAGAVVIASGAGARATAAPAATPASRSGRSKLYVCDVCGHVEFGAAPEFCPVCHTEEKFKSKDSIFSEAKAKLQDGGAKHIPVIRVQQTSTLVSDVPCKEILVRVGETMHEVEQANHIHFVDFYLDGRFFTRFFASPHLQPAVVLFVKGPASKVMAVSFCSMHGFWQAEAAL
jgi:desulfoferrodoxin-like iron-binding protein